MVAVPLQMLPDDEQKRSIDSAITYWPALSGKVMQHLAMLAAAASRQAHAQTLQSAF